MAGVFFYRKEALKTTWKFRLVLFMLVILPVFATRKLWTLTIGQSLVCTEEIRPSDVLLIENFDPNYLVFERAATLQRAGLAARVLIPTDISGDSEKATLVSQGIAEFMAQIARLREPEILPIHIREPISLHAAYQLRDFLIREHLRSAMIVTEGFRSQRSSLIYQAVLEPAGITVSCIPVFGQNTPQNWTMTWHGMQDVMEQFLKLQYYRFYVLWAYAT